MNYRLLGISLVALLMSCGGEEGGDSLDTGSLGGGGAGGSMDTGGATTGGTTNGGGTNAGTTTGSPVGGTGTSTMSDGGACQRTFVQANRAAPDMMIVMDASGSMVGVSLSDNLAVDRWGPAVSAVETVVGELEDAFKFGLMTYPGRLLGQPTGCTAGEVDVPLAINNAQPISNHLASTMPFTGQTPTAASLAEARAYLTAQKPTLAGEFPLPQYVMLVTDGDPNCVDVTDLGQAAGGTVDPGARQATKDEIDALTANNVKTYVIGYDTAGTTFAPYLDELAVLGNTGDMQHRSVTSGQQLLDEFRRITAGLVSCNFELATPSDFSMVNVYLDDNLTAYEDDWVLHDDGQTVELVGEACERLQQGATLEAEVVCEVVNII